MQPGAVLGHYQIAALIGRGGMVQGEVYRARRKLLRRRVEAIGEAWIVIEDASARAPVLPSNISGEIATLGATAASLKRCEGLFGQPPVHDR